MRGVGLGLATGLDEPPLPPQRRDAWCRSSRHTATHPESQDITRWDLLLNSLSVSRTLRRHAPQLGQPGTACRRRVPSEPSPGVMATLSSKSYSRDPPPVGTSKDPFTWGCARAPVRAASPKKGTRHENNVERNGRQLCRVLLTRVLRSLQCPSLTRVEVHPLTM